MFIIHKGTNTLNPPLRNTKPYQFTDILGWAIPKNYCQLFKVS
ncbi:MAG: hypothetical protein ACOC2Z_17065 [Coleofasciculus sp.]